jgi:hypothetical protein
MRYKIVTGLISTEINVIVYLMAAMITVNFCILRGMMDGEKESSDWQPDVGDSKGDEQETMDTGDGLTEEDLLKKADSLLTSPPTHKGQKKNSLISATPPCNPSVSSLISDL